MGVKKNGTKKRRIRGGDPIKLQTGFLSSPISNNIEQKEYMTRAMTTPDEAIVNLQFLIDQAQKQKGTVQFASKTKERVNTFVKAMMDKFKNDTKIMNELTTIYTNGFFKSIITENNKQSINAFLENSEEAKALKKLRGLVQEAADSKEDVTHESLNAFVKDMMDKFKGTSDPTFIGNIVSLAGTKFFMNFLSEDNKENIKKFVEKISTNLDETSSSTTSQTANVNTSSSTTSQTFGVENIHERQSSNLSMSNPMQSIASSNDTQKPDEIIGSADIIVSDSSDSKSNTNVSPSVDPAIFNGLPWAADKIIVMPKKTAEGATSFTLFGQNFSRYPKEYLDNVNTDISELEKHLKTVNQENHKSKNTNEELKDSFIAEFNKHQDKLKNKQRVDETKILENIKAFKALKEDSEKRANFLKTQQDVLKGFIPKSEPDITVAEAMAKNSQKADFIKAVFYCINLRLDIPVEDTKYYWVAPATKLTDIIHGSPPLILVPESEKTALSDLFNKGLLQKTTAYKSMFFDDKLITKQNALKKYKENLNTLKEIINKFLPIRGDRVAVTSGGAWYDNISIKSVNLETQNALRQMFSTYNVIISNANISNANISDANTQLEEVIKILQNSRITKDKNLASTIDNRDLSKNIGKQPGIIRNGEIIDDDTIGKMKYKEPSSNSDSASGGEEFQKKVPGGGSRKRKSPKKSPRKTSKNQ